MRAFFLRGFPFLVLVIALVAGRPPHARAQTPGPRSLAMAVEPWIPTRIESMLATPNLLLVTDYYRIDMRFGPNLRIDALVVEAIDARTRIKGLRVQVRDDEKRSRQEGTSFIDIDELIRLTQGLTSLPDRVERWTHDDRQATELTFTTAGGFRLAIRQSARVPRAYLSTGLIDPVVTSIDVADLPALKHAFDQALAILNNK